MTNIVHKINHWALYVLIFCLPWQTRLIWQEFKLNDVVLEFSRSSLFGWQIVLWIVLLTHIALLTRQRKPAISIAVIKKKLQKPQYAAYALIVVTILIAGLSIFWALDTSVALYRFFVIAQSGALLAYLITGSYSLIKLAVAWVSAAVLQSGLAIWQFFTQYIPANKWLGFAEHVSSAPGTIILETIDQRWMRAYGSLPHPNILGGFLTIGLLLTLWLGLSAKTYTQRMLLFIATVVQTIGLFFTFSRSAWIAAVIAYGLTLCYSAYRKELKSFIKQGFIILISFLTTLALLGLFTDLVHSRVFPSTELEYTSIDLRLTFSQQALAVITAVPLQGTGIGNYISGVYLFVNNTWPGWYYQAVHNIYLLVISELGSIAGVVFSAALALILYGAWRSRLSSQRMLLVLPLIALMIIGIMDHYLWSIEFGITIFFISIALSLQAQGQQSENSLK